MTGAGDAAGPDCPRAQIQVFLQPGEFHFGDARTCIRTVLGSCVAVTAWHPGLRVGGMCHYILPTRQRARGTELDGRYGDEAIELFLREMQRLGTAPREYQVMIFGGGNMFPRSGRNTGLDVGARNIDLGVRLLQHNGFQLRNHHLAGYGHRNVVFTVATGAVWVRQCEPPKSQ